LRRGHAQCWMVGVRSRRSVTCSSGRLTATPSAMPWYFRNSAERTQGFWLAPLRVARGLRAAGIRPRQHVGILAFNSAEFVEAFFGAALAGCVIVPLQARHRATELGYIIRDANLAALLTMSDPGGRVDLVQVVEAALPSLTAATDPLSLALEEVPSLRAAILLQGGTRPGFLGCAEFERLAATVSDASVELSRCAVRIRDTAVVLYTSGTTSKPKGCMLTHEALTRGPVERARGRLRFAPVDVTWGAGPLYHIGSLGPFLGSVGAAGTYLTDTHFDAGRALALMACHGATVLWPWFPAIVQDLLGHPSFEPSRLTTLRAALIIGPPKLIERVQAVLPFMEVLQACGMTETGGIFALTEPAESAVARATTQGKPVPGIEVRIVDVETGRDVADGKVGEILVRGYCVTDGYYGDNIKTAAAIDADGWLHTGDLYSRSASGSLIFNGRQKDMLKVGGENVAALEIEGFLCEHPAVKIAEVVGIPDPRLDEVPVAFVELREGASVAPQDLIDFCKGRIASYKIPRAIHYVEPSEWPMSATKVDKNALRRRLAPHGPGAA
jgi:fatty-acyl-CoA synthase